MPDREELKEPRDPSYPLGQIYFYLTEGCNLQCRHCWISPAEQPGGGTRPSLDFELLRSIVEQALPLGLSAVKLTGGETLLHPRIRDILRLAREKGLGLTVETNGVLCTPEVAAEISEHKAAFVAVSLDGIDAQTHDWIRGVKGCHEAALAGIRNLVRAGLRPQVIMTVMRRNQGQVEGMVRLAESLGAGSVKFNVVQPTVRGEQMHRAGETLSIQELVELGRRVENDLSTSAALRLYYSHPLAFRPLGRIFGENGDGCAVCGILGILGVLANGSYALCGIGRTVPELIFGHAATDPLEDVWNRAPKLKEIREGLPGRFQGVCRRCIMLSRCLGSCVAQNYYSSGGFWAPHWYCERAHQEGLFPETRLRVG